jgi:hypothetical protein
MVRYDLSRFVLEVGVVDAQVGVKPLNFVGNEFAWDKTLKLSGTVNLTSMIKIMNDLGSDVVLDKGALFFFAFEDWSSVTRKVLNAVRGLAGFY